MDDYIFSTTFEHTTRDGTIICDGQIHFFYDVIIVHAYDSERMWSLHPIWKIKTACPEDWIDDLLIIENGVQENTKITYMDKDPKFMEEKLRRGLQTWLVRLEKDLALTLASIFEEDYIFLGENTKVNDPLLRLCQCGTHITHESRICSRCELEECNDRSQP